MAAPTNAVKIGNLIGNPNPYPDAVTNGRYAWSPVAAAGTTQATATALSATAGNGFYITNNTAANGVILPVGVAGQEIELFPQLVTNAPRVYPPVGGTMNFGTVNVHVAATAQKSIRLKCIDDTGLNWVSFQGA